MPYSMAETVNNNHETRAKKKVSKPSDIKFKK